MTIDTGCANPEASICVIIAARNAETTIARAVRSALEQALVREVFVVDDASTDETRDAACAADDGTGRLRVLTLIENLGPAGARNRALAQSTSPFVAILDADDFLLPGRFGRLMSFPGWDVIVDNIVFVDEADAPALAVDQLAEFEPEPEQIDLPTFISANMSRPGVPRAEMGFAKPLIRRSLLASSGLQYDESLRLGEDYALYAQLIAAGARFLRIRTCGYVAVVHSQSLSGSHRTSDLAALLAFDRAFQKSARLTGDGDRALRRHLSQLERKVYDREVLDYRQAHGRLRGLWFAARRPAMFPGFVLKVVRDKLGALRAPSARREIRYLF